MPARKHVAPELIAEGKYLYEEALMAPRLPQSSSASWRLCSTWHLIQSRHAARQSAWRSPLAQVVVAEFHPLVADLIVAQVARLRENQIGRRYFCLRR